MLVTARATSNQYTILRGLRDTGGLTFEQCVSFNQVIFYSLIRREFIGLNPDKELFQLTDKGEECVRAYEKGDYHALEVAHNSPERQERVTKNIGVAALQKAKRSGSDSKLRNFRKNFERKLRRAAEHAAA